MCLCVRDGRRGTAPNSPDQPSFTTLPRLAGVYQKGSCSHDAEKREGDGVQAVSRNRLPV